MSQQGLGERPLPNCRHPQGIAIWSLNTCTLRKPELPDLIQSFSDSVRWDALCIQEGIRHGESGVTTVNGNTVVSGEGDAVGAPHLVLNPRLGSRLRRWVVEKHFVIASVGTTPPVTLFSLYLPAFSAHGSDPFDRVLADFNQKLTDMQSHRPGSFILGGADCNTQLREQPGQVGEFNGTSERLKTKSGPILSSVSSWLRA